MSWKNYPENKILSLMVHTGKKVQKKFFIDSKLIVNFKKPKKKLRYN